MPSSDPMAPDRLDALLDGAVPESEREARLQGLVRELRATPPAPPPSLRERLPETDEGRASRHRSTTWRRGALALACVVLLAVGGLAGTAAFGPSGRDESTRAEAAPRAGVPTVPTGSPAEELEPDADRSPAPARRGFVPSAKAQYATGADGSTPLSRDSSASGGENAFALTPPGRATDVDLWIELRLADADELGAAAGQAMAVTRELGGWVAGSDVDTEGREGTAELALRIPVGRVPDAVARLSGLGTITGQRVATVDLQAGMDARRAQLERLERQIRILELHLRTEDLDPQERLELELRLERLRGSAAELRRENRRDRREAATSELTLVLHTREAAPAGGDDEGGAAGAAREAIDFLGAAGAVTLFAAIVTSPFLVAAILLWVVLANRRRRIETRLLDRTTPVVPGSQPRV